MPDQPFDAWKEELRKDCEARGTLNGYEAMGDQVLKLLWESGIAPNVDAIAGNRTTTETNRIGMISGGVDVGRDY